MNDESDQFPMGTKKLLNLSKGRSPLQKNVILGKIPKERTPPNQPAGLTGDQKFHEKIICLEWSNMPYKHDIVFSLKSLGLLTPSPPPTHSLGIVPNFFFRGGGDRL